MFDHTSRYYTLKTLTISTQNGHVVVYKSRRFLPQAESMTVLTEVAVTQGDRLDLITARTLGAPEQFWQVCDANNALNPICLTDEIGRKLRIPMPQV